jgi:hypothetical protein
MFRLFVAAVSLFKGPSSMLGTSRRVTTERAAWSATRIGAWRGNMTWQCGNLEVRIISRYRRSPNGERDGRGVGHDGSGGQDARYGAGILPQTAIISREVCVSRFYATACYGQCSLVRYTSVLTSLLTSNHGWSCSLTRRTSLTCAPGSLATLSPCPSSPGHRSCCFTDHVDSCDADPGALADYVAALLERDSSESELRPQLTAELEDFLEKGASSTPPVA